MASTPEFEIVLVDVNDEEFGYHLPNELDKDGNPIAHREWTTGIDRKAMAVKGRMPTVVHGTKRKGSHVGYTVVVFDWYMPPLHLGKRFRKVVLEVAFTADGGKRGGAEVEAEQRRRNIRASKAVHRAYWDPEVEKFAPEGTSWYRETVQQVAEEKGFDLDMNVGFAPYGSIGPKFHWKKSTSGPHADAIQLTGEPAIVGSEGRARPNAVRWTILENASDRSGVPAVLRTAVLLKRRERDDGKFLGKVNVSYKVSPLDDFKESVINTVGRKKDHPVVFDPKFPTKASSYDTIAEKLATAEIDKEFHLVSFEPK